MELSQLTELLNNNQQGFQLGAAVAAAILMGGLLVFQAVRIRRLENQLKPKYGFLGKPLMSMVLFAVLASGIGLTYYASQNIQDVGVSANINLQLTINHSVSINSQTGKYLLKLNVIPTIDDTAWGNKGEEFDVFWKVTRDDGQSFSDLEIGISELKQGGVELELETGNYNVEISTNYKNKNWKGQKSILIPSL